MKLTDKEILEELATKGFTPKDISGYKNLDSEIVITCDNGHDVVTTLKTFRHSNFKCPHCIGDVSISNLLSGEKIPDKVGKRVIGIDNATKKVGVSVYDDGKLVYYHLFVYEGETYIRMVKNRKILEDIIIKEWKPDLVVLEDIQLQDQSFATFKTLAELLGSSLVSLAEFSVPFEIVLSSVWRNHFAIRGKERAECKAAAIKTVKEIFNLDVNDDVADAILLGKYACDELKRSENIKKLF